MKKRHARVGDMLSQRLHISEGCILSLSSVPEWLLMWHLTMVSSTFLRRELEESTTGSHWSFSPVTYFVI